MEAGQVFIPESAPWLADYLNEILAFPNGKYDDQVDSTSQFLTWERDRPRIHVG
jgi:predicted phage terminase large subunit-like protein